MSEGPRLPFIPGWLDELGLPQSWFRVYCHLWRRGECHSSADTIATACKMKRKTVFEALSHLEAAGLIRRTSRRGRTTLIEPVAPSDPCPMGHHVKVKPVPDSAQVPTPSGHRVEGDTAPQSPQVAVPDSAHGVSPSGHHEGISHEGSPTKESEKIPAPSFELSPADRVKAELAKVFPESLSHMTGAEHHDLFSALAVLDELTAEDWQAIVAWNKAPERVRGRKLWPRGRAEFVRHAGEAVETIRQWWKTGGRSWWNRREFQSEPKTAPAEAPVESGETIDDPAEALAFFRNAPAANLGGRPQIPTRQI